MLEIVDYIKWLLGNWGKQLEVTSHKFDGTLFYSVFPFSNDSTLANMSTVFLSVSKFNWEIQYQGKINNENDKYKDLFDPLV